MDTIAESESIESRDPENSRTSEDYSVDVLNQEQDGTTLQRLDRVAIQIWNIIYGTGANDADVLLENENLLYWKI